MAKILAVVWAYFKHSVLKIKISTLLCHVFDGFTFDNWQYASTTVI